MENNLQHSIDYITEKTGGKSGFTVPKGYFNSIENDVLCRLSEEKTSKSTSFEVPKNYFATLEDEILAKVTSKEKTHPKKKTKIISLKKLIPIVAAASVLLFISTYFLGNTKTSVSLDTITIAEIEDWYENGYSTTDTNELAMIFDEEDFNNIEISSISFEEQDLEDYFNSVETTDLINE